MANAIDYFSYDNKFITIKTHFSLKARRKMYDLFLKLTSPDEKDEILDLGATPDTHLADSNIFDYANGLVIQALEFWAEDRSLISYIRKAASRLDELIYGPQVPDA